MITKEEQKMQRHLRIFIKDFISQDMLTRFSSSLDEFKSLDKAVITLLSNEMKMQPQNIYKHFNGEQKYDAIDFLRYWQAYSQLWDKYYKLDKEAQEDMSEKKKLSIENFITRYDKYLELMNTSYIANPNILVDSFLDTFVQLVKFLEQVKRNDEQKKKPVLKTNHIATIEAFKKIPRLKKELERQAFDKFKSRLERMKD